MAAKQRHCQRSDAVTNSAVKAPAKGQLAYTSSNKSLRLLQNKQGQTAKRKSGHFLLVRTADPANEHFAQYCCIGYTAEASCWPFSKPHVRNKLTQLYTKHHPSAPQTEQMSFILLDLTKDIFVRSSSMGGIIYTPVGYFQ